MFFGEIPLEMERIQLEIEKATLMVVVGTSGSVYPAANLCIGQAGRGAHGLRGAGAAAERQAFTHVVEGKAGEVLPGLFLVE